MADELQNQNVTQAMINTSTTTTGDPVSIWGKIISGILLIGLTLFSGLYIIGHWPDKFVKTGDGTEALYCYEWFHVHLAGIKTQPVISGPENTAGVNARGVSAAVAPTETTPAATTPAAATPAATTPTGTSPAATTPVATTQTPAIPPADTAKKDSVIADAGKAATLKNEVAANIPSYCNCGTDKKEPCNLLHINTILLILVAFGGFLGNMIHIATSFTTFVGENSFKRSWLLWYCVKPFTASALAVTFYFVFRGGFLSMNDDGSSVNLNGLMTLAILSGLFTDRATLKLKEVFEVLMKPKEERSDPLTGNTTVVASVIATSVEAGKDATFIIKGTALNNGQLTVTIDGKAINTTDITAEQIKFVYPVPADAGAQLKVIITPDAKSTGIEFSFDVNKS